MSDEQSLIDSIVADPENRDAKSVYAGWLEEQSDPRAELLRSQLQVLDLTSDDENYGIRKSRFRELQKSLDQDWVAQVCGKPSAAEDAVREELKKVIDPELFVNIVDLGLIYVVDLLMSERGKTDVCIDMTMTSPMCPAGPQLIANSKQVVAQMEGIGDVEVKIVMDPPWTPDKMTEDARDQLGIF